MVQRTHRMHTTYMIVYYIILASHSHYIDAFDVTSILKQNQWINYFKAYCCASQYTAKHRWSMLILYIDYKQCMLILCTYRLPLNQIYGIQVVVGVFIIIAIITRTIMSICFAYIHLLHTSLYIYLSIYLSDCFPSLYLLKSLPIV